VSLQHTLLQTWSNPLCSRGNLRAGPYDMGRIAHRPLFALREAKPCGLRGLDHPVLEVIDGLRLGLSERRGRLGLRMDDIRGQAGRARWRGLRPAESWCRNQRARGRRVRLCPNICPLRGQFDQVNWSRRLS
jgi:hypothetical protein